MYDPKNYPPFIQPPIVYTLGEFPEGSRVTFKLRCFMPVHYGYLKYLLRQCRWNSSLRIGYQRYIVALLVIEPRPQKIMNLTEEELLLLFKPCLRLILHYQRQNYIRRNIWRGEFIFSNN